MANISRREFLGRSAAGITAARTGGVQNYFLEMSLDLMKPSVPYMKALKA